MIGDRDPLAILTLIGHFIGQNSAPLATTRPPLTNNARVTSSRDLRALMHHRVSLAALHQSAAAPSRRRHGASPGPPPSDSWPPARFGSESERGYDRRIRGRAE